MAELDARGTKVLMDAARFIQRQIRTYIDRNKFILLKKAIIVPQCHCFPFKQQKIRTDIDHNEFSAICYVRDYMFDHFQILKNISLETQSYSSQGNIIRWMKKEGDKVSLGEVLCEVETVLMFLDKATVEMECIEEGYLSKIVEMAAALALKKVPQCNSSWTNDYIRQYEVPQCQYQC
ncbi:hypothetical protein QQ045_008027 [Rhodiola kirilowii]